MTDLTFAELFAGAGGMSLGLEAAGWRCIAHAEIEPHARAVLRHRWPDVPLLGDVAQIDGAQFKGITMLTGGSPCQDLSIAGKRAGLAGARSGLWAEQVRIWRESAAPLLLWENVLGALSSNHGADFGVILGDIVGADVPVPLRGGKPKWSRAGRVSGPAGVALWRTLDLQHFGWDGRTTPQRRRRVFVLGVRAGAYGAGQLQALCDGLLGDHQTGGEAREGVAPDAAHRPAIAFQPGNLMRRAGPTPSTETFPTLGAAMLGDQAPHVVAPDAGRSVTGGVRSVAFQLTGDRDNPNVSVYEEQHPTLAANPMSDRNAAVLTYDARGNGDGVAPTLDAGEWRGPNRNQGGVIAVGNHAMNWAKESTPIVLRQQDALAFHATQDPISGDISPALGANAQIGALVLRQREGKPGGGKGPLLSEGQSLTLGTTNDQVVFPTLAMGAHTAAPGSNGQDAIQIHEVMQRAGVGVPRRLMPVETERLMGWPDQHTAHGIDEQGREYRLKDTPRYKLCGNGIGSPVTAWLGWQIRTALETAS